MAPYYWPALVGLQHNPRAMDIHSYLAYRLRNGLKRPCPFTRKFYTPCSAAIAAR